MDVVDLISDLAKLGQSKDGIEDILKLMGKDLTDTGIVDALSKVGTQTLNLTSIFQNFGQTTSNVFKGLRAIIVSNWKLLTAILAIGAVVGIANAIIKAPQKATEKMTESFGEFKNAQSEVEALNSELQKIKNNIADIQAKGNLSLIDKKELRNLRETEKSLEMQKDVAEQLAAARAEEAAQAAAVAYNKNFKYEVSQDAIDKSKSWIEEQKDENGGLLYNGIVAANGDISAQIALLQEYKSQRDSITSDASLWGLWNDKVKDTTNSLWEQADALMEQKTNLEESKNAIEVNGGTLTEYQQNALNNITSSLDYIYKELSPETWKQMKIDDLFATDQFSNTKKELTNLAKKYDNLSEFTNAARNTFTDFNNALLSNGIRMSDVTENIFAEAGIIDTDAVKKQLKSQFNKTANGGNWAKELNWANSLSDEDLKLVYKVMLDTDTAEYDLETWKNTLEEYKAIQKLDHGVDIATEQEGFEKVTSAISANASEVGLLEDNIDSLKSRYKALESFESDKLFENTANGIRLNTDELARLEDAYAVDNINKLNDALDVAIIRYQEAATQAKIMSKSKYANAYKVREENALDEVKAIEQLIAQYTALNGVYSKAIKASETPNSGAMYDNTKGLYDTAKELRKAGKVNTDDFQSFVELVKGDLGNDTGLADFVNIFDTFDDKIGVKGTDGKIKNINKSISDFFVEGQKGAQNFVSAIEQAGKILGQEWIKDNGDGTFDLNVDSTSLAEALGISEELAQILMDNLSQYWDIDTEPGVESTEELQERIQNTQETLEELIDTANVDLEPIEISIEGKDADGIKGEIQKVKDWISEINKMKLSPEVRTAALNDANAKLKLAYAELQNINGERFDLSSVDAGQKNVAAKWNEAKDAVAEYNAAVDTYGENSKQATTAQTDLNDALTNLKSAAQTSGIDKISDIDLNTEDAITKLQNSFDGLTLESIDISISEDPIVTATGTINYELGDIAVPENVTATGTINYELGDVAKPATGTSPADGTAWNSGSAFVNGTAFTRGDWGTKSDGIALGGELGQELIVRDGKFFTIGDKSAEFFKYKKNDIIFNAEQTKQILKQGRITRGHRRGKAMAEGTTGRAFNLGYYGTGNQWWGTGGSGGNSGNKKKDPDLMDWIEVLIDRIDRAIDSFAKKVDNIFDSFENRNKALEGQMETIREQIENQKQAYERYMAEADSVKLSDDLKELVQNGTIDISQYDKKTQEKIADYQEWYEKALDCKEAVDDLSISLSECYQTAFDNVVTQYEQLISVIEHGKAILDESISQSEARGYIVSTKYYETQIAEEQKIIDKIAAERAELIRKRDEAVMSGAIVEGSEAWMDMNEEINACTEEIEAANTSILELNNSIRDTEWQIFDLLQEKISNIAQETDFLIDLMSNDKLHDDKGVLTDEGFATIGLHSQNYNTYMAQADIYADEIAKLNKQIEDDPFDQDLLNRRQELLELQQDNILAAEDEKQAIVDLVQNGIDLELESLQELIDKYKEKLNVQKDLYDYNKELEEQTKEIATLEKQLAAYKGNESEEIKAKVQQIKVSLEEAKSNLEETQFDRFISDQEKLLDELYTEYEQILNERLDNVDELISDLIDNVNNNSSAINTTLSEKADSVGYTISDSIKGIWDNENGAKNVITKYGDDFLVKSTTTNNILNAINSNIMSMVSQLNVLAETDINGISSANEYSSGARKIHSNEVAWTQEGSEQEYIVRPSDGAILTPVAQDDDILNAQASNNIWSMANNPVDFIRDNLVSSTPAPVVKSNNQSFTQHFDKVVFSMPNVTNYSEMLNEMKRDRKFEKLVTAMTIDRLSGKSHLGVGKSF